MTGCCALHCKNRSENGFKVYGFPRDPSRRTIWEKRIGRLDSSGKPWMASRCAKLCEVHFEEDEFELHRIDGKKKLKWNAIPSIFAHSASEASQLQQRKVFRPMPLAVPSYVLNHKDHSYSCLRPPPATLTAQSNDSQGKVQDVFNTENDIRQNEDEIHIMADDHAYQIRTVAGKHRVKMSRLRDRIKDYQFQLRKAREENVKLQKRQSKVREGLSRLFGSDQLQALRRGGSMRGIEWTPETVQKALNLYAACGKKGYNHLLEQHFPLPSIRTLQRHVGGLASSVKSDAPPRQSETEPVAQDADITLESISSMLASLATPEKPLSEPNA